MIFRRDHHLRLIALRMGWIARIALFHEGRDEEMIDALIGQDLEPLTNDFVEEILLFNVADHEDLVEMTERDREERDG